MKSTEEQYKALDEVRQHEQKLLTAVKNRDLDSLDELIHDQLLFVIPGGHTATKAMDLEAHRSGQMKVDDISSLDQTIHLVDDTAVASVLIQLKGEYSGERIDGKYRYLRIWKAFGDKWQIIAGSCTAVA